jgi:hypothetical protein
MGREGYTRKDGRYERGGRPKDRNTKSVQRIVMDSEERIEKNPSHLSFSLKQRNLLFSFLSKYVKYLIQKRISDRFSFLSDLFEIFAVLKLAFILISELLGK